MSDRHGLNSLEHYLNVHDGKLDVWSKYFLIEDRLSWVEAGDIVHWEGELIFRDGLEIHVEKYQACSYRESRPYVRTLQYSYHVVQRSSDGTVRNLWRYDNADHHPHPTRHHRHDCLATNDEHGTVRHVGPDWPTLGDVIEELHEWWYANLGSDTSTQA